MARIVSVAPVQFADYPPILIAAANGDHEEFIELAESLLRDTDENIRRSVAAHGGWNNSNALHLASTSGCVEIVRYLLKSPAIEIDINATNVGGDTALILAAESGHLDVIKLLVASGANLDIKNTNGFTALMAAVDRGCLHCIGYICSSGSISESFQRLQEKNILDKSSSLLACDNGHDHVVAWMLERYGMDIMLDSTNRGITTLMLACAKKSSGHENIIRLLLNAGLNVNVISKWKWSALIWAVTGEASISTIELLLNAGANINQITLQNDTALTKAIENGRMDIIELLLSRGVEYDSNQMFALALSHTEIIIALYFFIESGSDHKLHFNNITNLLQSINSDFDRIVFKLSTIHSNKLLDIAQCASCYEFFFELFLQLAFELSSPTQLLQNNLIYLLKGLLSNKRGIDIDILSKLVRIGSVILKLQQLHPHKIDELQSTYTVITKMIEICLASNCYENKYQLYAILSYSGHHQYHHDNELNTRHYPYRDICVRNALIIEEGALAESLSGHVKSLFSSSQINSYVSELFWNSLRTNFSKSTTNVYEFWMVKLWLKWSGFYMISPITSRIFCLKSNFIFLRYFPVGMFCCELLSKLLALALVIYIAFSESMNIVLKWRVRFFLLIHIILLYMYQIGEVKSRGKPSRDMWSWLNALTMILIAIWIVSRLIVADRDNIQSHYRAIYDFGFGAICFANVSLVSSLLQYLSLNQSIGQLTLVIHAVLHDLVVFGVVYIIVLAGFVVSFSLLAFGYDIHEFRQFLPSSLTLVAFSLGQYDADFPGLFAHTGNSIVFWGVLLQLSFIFFFSTVFLNLIIARLSTTYGNIDIQALQEWQFYKAETLHRLLLVKERHAFCMLPAPLNVISTLIFVFEEVWNTIASKANGIWNRREDYSAQQQENNHKRLSWTSSISDIMMGLVMAWIAPIIELFACISNVHSALHRYSTNNEIEVEEVTIASHQHQHIHDHYDKDKEQQRHMLLWELFFILISFPIIYPVYVITLSIEAFKISTYYHKDSPTHNHNNHDHEQQPHRLSYAKVQQSIQSRSKMFQRKNMRTRTRSSSHLMRESFLIVYPIHPFYTTTLQSINDNEDYIEIHLQKIMKLKYAHYHSNPIVCFQLGTMETFSPPSLYGGKEPLWLNTKLRLPLWSLTTSVNKSLISSSGASDSAKQRKNRDYWNIKTLKLIIIVYDRCDQTGSSTKNDANEIHASSRPINDSDLLLGSNVRNAISIAPWLASKRGYSGSIVLDDGAGEVLLSITPHFPNFLKSKPSGLSEKIISDGNDSSNIRINPTNMSKKRNISLLQPFSSIHDTDEPCKIDERFERILESSTMALNKPFHFMYSDKERENMLNCMNNYSTK